jgi:esterase/lipase superfamily enzyme
MNRERNVYVVTNREINEAANGLRKFGSRPNPIGPNELRLVEVVKQGADYQTTLLKDQLEPEEVDRLKIRFQLPDDFQGPYFASLRAACETLDRARQDNRHILIYVHGYNNDIGDVLNTAEALEALYRVVVVPFSWPTNGGGTVGGAADYLDDKQDARVSMDALNRLIDKIDLYHELLTRKTREQARANAQNNFQNNRGAARANYSERLAAECQVTLNLACHSMGNYVLQYAFRPNNAASRRLVFDNVSLISADANNKNHQEWVESIQVRNRLYITINEDDYALAWSRRKPGDEQLDRLGNYLRNLSALNAYYIDVTGAPSVGSAHNYFTGLPVENNPSLNAFFADAFEGRRGEKVLRYAADVNVYRFREF